MFGIRRYWLLPGLVLTAILFYLINPPLSLSLPTGALPAYLTGSTNDKVYINPLPLQRHPVTDVIPLPPTAAGISKRLPKIQFDFAAQPPLSARDKKIQEERKAAIREAFVHSFNGYKKYAWGRDEVGPITGSYRSSFGSWGASLVDSLDTLWILGLKEDFEQGVQAVMQIDFTYNSEEALNVFETTIRYLGGLLSAYDLSEGQYPQLLDRAKELADILLVAFDTPNHMPVARWVWRQSVAGVAFDAADNTLLAEFGSLTLEFTHLAQLTGDNKYYDAVQRIALELYKSQATTQLPGLWPTLVNARELRFDYNHFTFGGMADSTYEYLAKQYILLNGAEPMYKEMYINATNTASTYLFFRPMTPDHADILFSGNTALSGEGQDRRARLDPQGQHLSCFIPGMLAIGSRLFSRRGDIDVARRLLDGCLWAYGATPSGLMPETFHLVPCHRGVSPAPEGQCNWSEELWYRSIADRREKQLEKEKEKEKEKDKDDKTEKIDKNEPTDPLERGKYLAQQKPILPGFIEHDDNRFLLRPEAIESVFILYRVTGDRRYQDIAWKMWQSIDSATRTDIAYAALTDVRQASPAKADRMESFWLAETLKYFYLIFEDTDVISLDDWVLNTEAHPFRRPR